MTAPVAFSDLDSPVGRLRAEASPRGLARVVFLDSGRDAPDPRAVRDDAACAPFVRALDEYFAGARHDFADVPLDVTSGTPFERAVWAQLARIPFGETVTYGDLARRLGNPGASRAVGRANGQNPVPIVVPCHRVVAAGGGLGGYSGSLDVKRRLLALERARGFVDEGPRQVRLV